MSDAEGGIGIDMLGTPNSSASASDLLVARRSGTLREHTSAIPCICMVIIVDRRLHFRRSHVVLAASRQAGSIPCPHGKLVRLLQGISCTFVSGSVVLVDSVEALLLLVQALLSLAAALRNVMMAHRV